jgi:aryl-alcohol dehydrogenase-like predicted oxidoreductase
MAAMETRPLPHTGLTVSRACFGTMTFGVQSDQALSTRLVERCLDAGINFFDTANAYSFGVAETILGNALKGRRGEVVLASKVGFTAGPGPGDSGLKRDYILREIDASLRRLQTDYVDLYYLHIPDWNTSIEESLEAMNEVVRAGKARHIACSNYASWQIVEMQWISQQRGYRPPHVTQVMYSLLVKVATVIYNPLAGGLLTAKHQIARPIAGSRFEDNKLYLDRYWHPAYFDAVDELKAIAAAGGRSIVEMALNWVWHHTPTDSMIIGASRMDQLEENLAALEKGPLPADMLAACEQVWQRLRGVTPNYNR